MKPVVFLDRDGTINVEVNYLKSPDELRLIDGAAQAINQLKAAGYAVIVVTNQSGVARQFMTIETLQAIHDKLRDELAAHGARVDGIYVCVHHPDDGCECRKPRPSLFLQAAREHDLDLRRAIMIGDKDTDLLAARNLSIPSILVRTGFGESQLPLIAQWNDYRPIYVADDLRDAANWLIADSR